MRWVAAAVLFAFAHVLIERGHFPAVPVLLTTAFVVALIATDASRWFSLWFRPLNRHGAREAKAVTVRPIVPEDIPVVAGMAVTLSRHHGFNQDLELTLQRLRSWVADPNAPNKLIVAVTEDERIVGYAHYLDQCVTTGAEPYRKVTELFVVKDKRNCGIGRVIVDGLRQLCKDDAINLLAIEVMDINLVARGFYRRLGLHPEKRLTYFDLIADPRTGSVTPGYTKQSATGQTPVGATANHPATAE